MRDSCDATDPGFGSSNAFFPEPNDAPASRTDPRLAFLHRAAARLALVETGAMSLDEAIDGLIEPCTCVREILDHWERAYPPRRLRWRR